MIRIFKCKMNENLNINQCVGGKEGELHQSVKLAPIGLVGSNPIPHTNIKGETMSLGVPQFIQSNKHIMDGVYDKQGLCNECGTHKATVNYNNGNYCNWYCAKKGDK